MKHFLICILMILVACNKHFQKDDNVLTITAISTDFETKASETAFEAGDKIGVFLEHNTPNLRYETSDGRTWNGFGNPGEFKSGDNVIAYYPYSQTATSQSAIEVSSGLDFMITEPTTITVADNKAAANLKFKHALSKLVATIVRPEEIAGVKTVSLENIIVKNVYRKGTINLADGKFSSLSDKGDVVLNSGAAIIIPQTISRIEFVFKMADGTSMTQAHTKDLLLESGKQTTLNAVSNADLYFTSTLDLKSGEAQTNLPLSFYVAPGRTWTLKSSEPWLTFSATTGVGSATVKVSVAANNTASYKPRTTTLTLTDDKSASVLINVTQNYIKKYPVVKIGNTYWTIANLTGTKQGQTSGFTTCSSPEEHGLYFKWGSLYAYDRISGDIPKGHWITNPVDYSCWAATAPIGITGGYDYDKGLSSKWGAPVGDPCNALGAYRTPTSTQTTELCNSGYSVFTTYKNKKGMVFGPGASSYVANAPIPAGCIFMPDAGYRFVVDGVAHVDDENSGYWSSSTYNEQSWSFGVNGHGIMPGNPSFRGYGFSVRCVAE